MRNGAPSTTLGAVCTIALGLMVLGCGGSSPDADRDAEARTASSAEEHTHASGETHSHEEESSEAQGSQDEHTHADGSSHAHAAMDTVSHDVALQANGSDLAGHVAVLRGADTLRVMVEVQEANADARYDARLLSGECGASGDRIASLTPVLTGSSGSGSSQATVPGSAVSGHAHGAVLVVASGGGATACAPVHLGEEHSHGG